MFSLEQLLFAIANDQRSKDDTIVKVLPMLVEVYEIEKENRQALKARLTLNNWVFIIFYNFCFSECGCEYY